MTTTLIDCLKPASHPNYENLSASARHVSDLVARRLLVGWLLLAAPLLAFVGLATVNAATMVLVGIGALPSSDLFVFGLLVDLLHSHISLQVFLAIVVGTGCWLGLRRRLTRMEVAQTALLEGRVEPQLVRVWQRGRR